MVLVAGGEFDRGTPGSDGDADERPVRRVRMSPFCIDRTEVTVRQFRARLAALRASATTREVVYPGGVRVRVTAPSDPSTDALCNWSDAPADHEDHPINCVDWNTAQIHCAARGMRLATETEWEYAARGQDGRRFPWGDDAPNETRACWSGPTGREGTCATGSRIDGASPSGALDMAGNVWEWTADAYAPTYARPDAVVSRDGAARVVRGGSWADVLAADLRGADRGRFVPETRRTDVGFRCVRAPLTGR
jgi:formylglycine-generating enzyme required for sulfatase activity